MNRILMRKLLYIVVILSMGFLASYTPTPRAFPLLVVNPDQLNEPGKIWLIADMLLINDKYTGIHFYDIADKDNPSRLGFLTISNNLDMAVYGNTLYADSYGHLMIYDISTPSNPVLMNILSNAVGFDYDMFGFLGDDTLDWGWGFGCACGMAAYSPASAPNSQGGSMARFAIAGNMLYSLKDNQEVIAFDLTDPLHPVISSSAIIPVQNAETLFPYNNKLFVGSDTGMAIFSISDPTNPVFINTFEHAIARDPVVVANDVAYITLRNASDAPNNRLEAVYLNDYTNFIQLEMYALNWPLGLGVSGDELYVCDSSYGLAHFNISNFNNADWWDGLTWDTYVVTNYAYDLIPLTGHVILSGNEVGIYQIEADGSLSKRSTIN